MRIKGADLKDEFLFQILAAFRRTSLYGGQFTLSTPLINQIFVSFSGSSLQKEKFG